MSKFLKLFLTLQLTILSGILFAQDTTHVSAKATLFSVHIDEVVPEQVQRFEDLNATQMRARSKVYKENHVPIPPGYEYSATGSKYFSLRPRSSYVELDKPSKLSDKVKKLLKSQVDPYSDTIHPLLRFHHNELWMLDTAGSYLPIPYDPEKMNVVHIRMEWVVPKMGDVYDSVHTLFLKALQKINAPVACLSMYSMYGNGTNIYLYHAHNNEEIQQVKDPVGVLQKAYGREEAFKIYQLWQTCLFSYDDLDATPRPDLTDLQPGVMWLGVKGRVKKY